MKYKSYAFWTSLSAAVVVLATTIAKMFGVSINDKLISDFVMAIAGILIVFGIVKMPSQKQQEELSDEEEKKEE